MKTLKVSIAVLAFIALVSACQSEGKNTSADSLNSKNIDSSANRPIDTGVIKMDTSSRNDTTHMH